ncbi:MAG: LPD7 domain-containing protein [Arcobacteraceae bacterium]
MISRVTMRKSGLADYLLSGKKEDSSHVRKEKDNVIPLFGNLEQLKFAEQYCNKYKSEWKNNYEHITIGFNKEDMARLENLSHEEYKQTLKSIVNDFIKHRCSGYDIENEIIAYAEWHEPKIKFENGKERLTHIHIGISYLNALNNSKIRTAFYNNSYISDALDKYVAKKHNLTAVTPSKIKEIPKSKWGQYKQQLVEEFKTISSRKELLEYFATNGIEYREIKTKNNHYFKVVNKGMKDINLRGKGFGFEHISEITSGGELAKLKNKSLLELEKILLNYYEQRSTMIDKRRSKETKDKLEEIHRDRSYENEIINRKKSWKYLTYQQKIFQANYGHMIQNQLKGYFVGQSSYYKDSFLVSNKTKSINIIDKGDEIVSTKETENLEEEVRIMLEIALAKGWDFEHMDITGDDEFIKESQRQIAEILLKKEESLQERNKIIESKIERPTSLVTQFCRENQEKLETQNATNDITIKELKLMLSAEIVLQYAVSKYKVNADDFEITDDNKINKKTNRKKPKSIIDFLIEEIHVDTKTAISMCRELFKEQKEEFVNTEVEKHKKVPVDVLMDMPMVDVDNEAEKEESQNEKAKEEKQPKPKINATKASILQL